MDLLAQPRLGADAVEIADQQHADHQLGVDRGAARVAVMLSQAGADEREIENGVDAAQQVIGWNVSIYAEDIEELRFPDLPPHHCHAPSLTQAEGITTEHSSQQRVFHRYRPFLRQHEQV